MTAFFCVACGSQFSESDSPPALCPICTDPRQYVPPGGQRWTTLDELQSSHRSEIRADGELTGVGTEPWFSIGQRALLVPHGDGHLMWDCVSLIDDAAVEEIERRGGLTGIAISHPHYYSGMVEWARRFRCPIHLHAADARWIMRPDPAVQLWEGDVLELGHGVTLIRCGGHFAGGTVLHWAEGAGGRGALLAGDIVQLIPDPDHVAFMYSYPNLIPLSPDAVAAIASTLRPFDYEAIYGAWWGRLIPANAKDAVERSAERYGRAVRGELE